MRECSPLAPATEPKLGTPHLEVRVGERRRRYLGATAWIAGVAVWLVLQVAAALQWEDPAYDWTINYVSDLGNTTCGPFTVPGGEATYVCSPAHELMNIGFVFSGVLTVIGAILLWRWWPPALLARVASALYCLTGAGRVIVGFNPEDVDIIMHMVGALVQAPSSIAVLLSAITLRRTLPAVSRVGMGLGALGVLGAVLALGGQAGVTAFHLGFGPGLPERLASHPLQVWIVVVGVAVIVSTRLRNGERRDSGVIQRPRIH